MNKGYSQQWTFFMQSMNFLCSKNYFNDNADDKWKLNLNYHSYIVKVNVLYEMKNEWQEDLYDHI